MVTEAAPGERHAVRIQVRCGDVQEFEERFAPRYAADGILLPGVLPVPVGTQLRFTVELQGGRRVLSGRARVDAKMQAPAGTRLRIVRLDPGSVPLAPVLAPVGSPPAGAKADAPARHQHRKRAHLGEVLFADLQPPEELAASKPIEVRRSPVKLRLRPTPPSHDPSEQG